MDCSAQAQLSFSYSRAAAQWQLLTEENVSRYTRPDFSLQDRYFVICANFGLHFDNIASVQNGLVTCTCAHTSARCLPSV